MDVRVLELHPAIESGVAQRLGQGRSRSALPRFDLYRHDVRAQFDDEVQFHASRFLPVDEVVSRDTRLHQAFRDHVLGQCALLVGHVLLCDRSHGRAVAPALPIHHVDQSPRVGEIHLEVVWIV